MASPGPLWRRSPLRLLRGGAWGVLVLVAFVLLTTAAAAVTPTPKLRAKTGRTGTRTPKPTATQKAMRPRT